MNISVQEPIPKANIDEAVPNLAPSILHNPKDPRRLLILTNTHMFVSQCRQQKPQFLIDGLQHGTYIISERRAEKKTHTVIIIS